MLRICLFLMLALCLHPAYGQGTITVENGTLSSTSNYSNMTSYYSLYDGEVVTLVDESIGTPYLQDDYTLGSIMQKNQVLYSGLYMKLDALRDIILVKTDLQQENPMQVTPSSEFSVKIGNQLFVGVASNRGISYCQVLGVGKRAQLLKRHAKNYKPKSRATTSLTRDIPAKYLDEVRYYLMDTDANFHEIPRSKRKAAAVFKGYEDEIEACIEKYDLDLKEESDLIRLVRYYNSL